MTYKLANPGNLIIRCKAVLAEELNNSHIGFSVFNKPGNLEVYELQGNDFSKAQTRYQNHVLPFLFSENLLYYWIGVTLEFQFVTGSYNFRDISVVIFEGMPTNNEKTPLLRAEWSDFENLLISHAQPHWHIYPSFINKNITSILDLETNIVDFSPSDEVEKTEYEIIPEWKKCSTFHFAMASRWHKDGKDAHVENINESKLVNWLKGCICYTRDQLLYLEKKN